MLMIFDIVIFLLGAGPKSKRAIHPEQVKGRRTKSGRFRVKSTKKVKLTVLLLSSLYPPRLYNITITHFHSLSCSSQIRVSDHSSSSDRPLKGGGYVHLSFRAWNFTLSLWNVEGYMGALSSLGIFYFLFFFIMFCLVGEKKWENEGNFKFFEVKDKFFLGYFAWLCSVEFGVLFLIYFKKCLFTCLVAERLWENEEKVVALSVKLAILGKILLDSTQFDYLA